MLLKFKNSLRCFLTTWLMLAASSQTVNANETSGAASSTNNVTAIVIEQIKLQQNALIVTATEPLATPATCVDANNTNQFSFDINTDTGRVMHTLLLTGMATNNALGIHRSSDCSVTTGIERINGLSINDVKNTKPINYLKIEQENLVFSTPQAKQHVLPSCVAAENQALYGFKINSSDGRALYSTLLTALTSDIPLTLVSSLNCDPLGNIEYLAGISLNLANLASPDFQGNLAFDYGYELVNTDFPMLLCIRANDICVAMSKHDFELKYSYLRTAGMVSVKAVSYKGLSPESWGYRREAIEFINGTNLQIIMQSTATNNIWTCRFKLKNIETNLETDFYHTKVGSGGSHWSCNFDVNLNSVNSQNYIGVFFDASGNYYSKHSVNFVSDSSTNMIKMLHQVDTTYKPAIGAAAYLSEIKRK